MYNLLIFVVTQLEKDIFLGNAKLRNGVSKAGQNYALEIQMNQPTRCNIFSGLLLVV
jgi:hypothetical protein